MSLRTLTRNVVDRGRMTRRSASSAARPPRLRRRRALRLTHALVASDLNPLYLDFWPLVRRAWSEVAGLEPLLVLIAKQAQVPALLRDDPAVHVFTPVPDVHTAFQAQCIRLLYPAVLDIDGAVITSDADMVPMNRRYFHRPAARVEENHFVAYRDVLLGDRQIPICYNAALPRTWADVFRIGSLEDVRARLSEWAAGVDYAGKRGGEGWATDQQILYQTLIDYRRGARKAWILDDRFTGFRRLERGTLWKQPELDRRQQRRIARGRYSDFHCVSPHSEARELNELAVELAVGAARHRAGRWTVPRVPSIARVDTHN